MLANRGPRRAVQIESVSRPAQNGRVDRRVVAEAPKLSDKVQVAGLGSQRELNTLAARMLVFYGVPENERTEAVWRQALLGAQLCVAYGFVPNVHVRMFPDAGEWVCDAGLRAWVESANRLARQMRFTYFVQEEQLEPDEMKIADLEKYEEGDVGWGARVLRSDELALTASAGIAYDPAWAYGFWHKRAYVERNEQGELMGWRPDPVWKGRTTSDVARQRAHKAALMASSITLTALDELTPGERYRHALRELEADEAEADRKIRDASDPVLNAPFAPSTIRYEENGDVLFK